MKDLSNEQLAEVILFTHEQNVRVAIGNHISELLGPIAKGHAHFDDKMLEIILKIVKG
jgi:hypothetical protein